MHMKNEDNETSKEGENTNRYRNLRDGENGGNASEFSSTF